MALTTAAAGWWAAALLKLPGARALTANEGRMVYAAVGLTTSVAASVESSRAAEIPLALSESTWSFIKAINGETTSVRPSKSKDGSW